MILTNKTYKTIDMVLLSFKTTPVYSAFYSLRNLINAFIPTANIFITAWFIETALRILRDGANIGSIALPIVFLASIMVYHVFLSRIFGFFDLKNTHVFRTRIGAEVLEKRARLQYRCMEDRSSLDLIMRVARRRCDKKYVHGHSGTGTAFNSDAWYNRDNIYASVVGRSDILHCHRSHCVSRYSRGKSHLHRKPRYVGG